MVKSLHGWRHLWSTILKDFFDAQEHDFLLALKEIRVGRKKNHWIWYIFPQLKQLGRSSVAKYYGIEDIK